MVDKSHKRRSFSLAEVLVTLTVIGVLAAMTIPPLVQNYQKQEYVTKLKKAYTTTNQVLQQLAADMGCTGDLKCTGLFSSTSDGSTIGEELVKYFRTVKICKNLSGCFSENISVHYDGSTPPIRTSIFNNSLLSSYSFITQDGSSFTIWNKSDDCHGDEDWTTYKTGNLTQVCGLLWVDVNGPTKGPNNFGRDIYEFYISNGKGPLLYPSGGADDKGWLSDGAWQNPSTLLPRRCYSGETRGEACAGRIIEEGWEMNY